MSLFEKIFNYQIVSRLDESGAFATTSQERVWLQSMLADSAAIEAFTPSTLDKLRQMLADDEPMEVCGKKQVSLLSRYIIHSCVNCVLFCVPVQASV
ncbi:hypothetical protein GMA19_00912 [Paenibacillus polymyxa E681]|nr:hypothetical protein GE561_00913 [Paenibacillus polymyxa E681]QNV60596.1 hypothetical protein GMA19_00912 [Paenibacillus polymyxa E681]